MTLVLVAAVFLFINPFKRNRNEVPRPFVASDLITELTSHIVQRGLPPEEYLSGLFDSREVVFVAEYGQIRQHVEVIARTIPLLHARGVRRLGLEIVLFEDSDRIDTILTASDFDETAVHGIFFNRMIIWGFSEYVDIFRSAWEVNRGLHDDEEPFRIVGLSTRANWQEIETEQEAEDPEVIARVYEDGLPDSVMADIIMSEFVRKGEAALVLTEMSHAFTSYLSIKYVERAEEIGLSEARRAGNIVYDIIGSRAATVLFHAPWPYKKARNLVVHPVQGSIDGTIENLPEEWSAAGFDVAGTPFAELSARRSDFFYGYEDLVLSELADGYIITGPIASYEMVTPIPEFITAENIDEAIRGFPGPNIEGVTPEELNAYIASLIEGRKRIIDLF